MIGERRGVSDVYVRRPSASDTTPAVLSGESIVCLTHEPWHDPWKTSQQIMSIVAESNRVLYIGPPVSLRDAIGGLRTRATRGPVLERIGASLFVYHEPRFLARANSDRLFGRAFNRYSSSLRLAHARWLARRLGFDAPILCIFDPMFAHAVGAFAEKFVIYYVMDNYIECLDPAAVTLRSATARGEARMLREADMVVAVSARLQERCLRHNPRSFWVPNGVDYDLFQVQSKKPEIPPDMARIARPIVGYVGVIQPDIDFRLLERMATEHPEWSLVFVGPEELSDERSKLEALFARPNVHSLGCKPVGDVPLYISNCDVCIMPNMPDKSTVPDCDSIKLYEYLACGRPVVSTDTPSVRRFLPLVRIASDPAGFIRCVEDSLAEDPRLSELRRAVAGEHSWRRRVAVLAELIAAGLSPEALAGRRNGSSAAGGARV